MEAQAQPWAVSRWSCPGPRPSAGGCGPWCLYKWRQLPSPVAETQPGSSREPRPGGGGCTSPRLRGSDRSSGGGKRESVCVRFAQLLPTRRSWVPQPGWRLNFGRPSFATPLVDRDVKRLCPVSRHSTENFKEPTWALPEKSTLILVLRPVNRAVCNILCWTSCAKMDVPVLKRFTWFISDKVNHLAIFWGGGVSNLVGAIYVF